MHKAYQRLVEELELDAVVLVDGGTDSLMRGDEDGLGTPNEDLTSIAAVNGLEVETKLLVCLGFGVDAFHGVCHHYFLEAVAELTGSGHFLGAFSLLPDHAEARLLDEASRYVFEQMPEHQSIVVSSILDALRGKFGDHHATDRTTGSELYINPLMSLYWSFHLEGVARRCRYIESLWSTQTQREVSRAILRYRSGVKKLRPWREMPL